MKKFLALIVLSVAVCATAGAAVQEKSEGAESKAEAKKEEGVFPVVARWANFIVLFGGLIYLLRKPASEFFSTRSNDIAGGLQRAQDAQTSAQARMDEIEKRLAQLSSEVSGLRAEAEKESLTDREKILAEAKREVERVIEQSRQEIERVGRTVEREIKEHIADLVIDRAGNTLRTEMTQDDQKRIVVRFIQKL
jgi:F-type H+-transporting ATPase subunit b